MNPHAALVVLALVSASTIACSGAQSNTSSNGATTSNNATTSDTPTASNPATASNTTPAPTPTTPPAETTDRVCCESFGYGARMVECCQRVEWTTAAACTVSPGHVGGGRRVVDNARCASAPTASTAPAPTSS